VFYETDKRKTQENHQILAHKLQAVKRARSLVHRDVYTPDADLCLVGNPGILIPKSKPGSGVCNNDFQVAMKQISEGEIISQGFSRAPGNQ
jgi:hypothetical protein